MHGPTVMLLMNYYIRNKLCLNQCWVTHRSKLSHSCCRSMLSHPCYSPKLSHPCYSPKLSHPCYSPKLSHPCYSPKLGHSCLCNVCHTEAGPRLYRLVSIFLNTNWERQRQGGGCYKNRCLLHTDVKLCRGFAENRLQIVFFSYPSHISIAMDVLEETSQLMCTVPWVTPSSCARWCFLPGALQCESVNLGAVKFTSI